MYCAVLSCVQYRLLHFYLKPSSGKRYHFSFLCINVSLGAKGTGEAAWAPSPKKL
jgi:hypothetical protein